MFNISDNMWFLIVEVNVEVIVKRVRVCACVHARTCVILHVTVVM